MPQYIKTYEQAIPSELCRDLIQAFEQDSRVAKDDQPDYTTRRFLYLSDKPEWSSLCLKLTEVGNTLVERYFDRPDELAATRPADWIDDGYVMACYDEGDTIAIHTDGQCPVEPANGLRLATLLIYLNTVDEGGETFFPLQDVAVKPVEGRAVIFPPGHMHPHGVHPPKGKRYIVQTWITDPDLVVSERSGW
ncbi:prolyl hydroxylase family protein [Pseudobacteriovorax antillogorgiicola]|uniref:2OG-Fe(II) oxygenase superfamily protein n=1 Tax=Pseudobacteriovorax antillogorgiicola TaxID=1513793 RepID=A0A1Y6CFY7_9BACT|nr:2OG-Fe(II) oxygenase [Pseudobacteriovorax antillogorgiicola]TCS49010.1 2-oxoglutarate-Fe(II)-dependent oxygenase superfamily protein [Pseudobacteriovorax antillogorgiicola]SMF53141.1 2OG-Fe(II) oxygenase superfamily protein [Pseudobacteriovorax antillogorgiicola]